MQAQAREGLLRILSDSAIGRAVRALTNHIAENSDVYDDLQQLLAVVPYANVDEESADALCLGGQDASRLRSELADVALHQEELADEDREQLGVFDPDSDVLLSVVDGELHIGVSEDLLDAASATPAAFALVTLRVLIQEGADSDEWHDDADAGETVVGGLPIDVSDLDFTEMTLGEIGDAIGQRLEAAYDAAIEQASEEELQRQLTEAGEDPRARMMIFSRFQRTDAALAEAARAFPGADAVSRLNAAQVRALIYRDAERWDEALAELTHALGVLNELPDEPGWMLGRTRLMHMIGQIYLVQRYFDQAEEYIDRANALLVSLSAQAPRERQLAGQHAFGIHLLGDLEVARYEEHGNRQTLDRAEAAYQEALARCKQARVGRDHPVRHYLVEGLEHIAELRKQVDQGSGEE
jgi:tetratricopeptide (TPR) repeat protein